jgi:hypothetical protein
MVIKAQQNNTVAGLISNIISKGNAIMHYADDTIICLKDDVEKASHLKLVLYIYI